MHMRVLSCYSFSQRRQLQQDTEQKPMVLWKGPWWSSSCGFALLLGLSAFVKGLLNGQYNYRKVNLSGKQGKEAMLQVTLQAAF